MHDDAGSNWDVLLHISGGGGGGAEIREAPAAADLHVVKDSVGGTGGCGSGGGGILKSGG